MNWADGLNATPGALATQARQLVASHSALRQVISDLQHTDVGPWQGKAARGEVQQRQQLVDTLDQQAQVIPPVADALTTAATTFTELQEIQRQLGNHAAQLHCNINNLGLVSAPNVFDFNPSRTAARAKLQMSALSVTLRLNEADQALAERIRAASPDISQPSTPGNSSATAWLGCNFGSGFSWLRDKANGMFLGLGKRAVAITSSSLSLWDTLKNPPRWWKDMLLKGETPQIAEVLAAAVYVAGQGVNIVASGFTGEDHRIFSDGRPWSGVPVEFPDVDPFSSPSELMNPAMETYQTHDSSDPSSRAKLQVTAVEGTDGTVRYVVSIPGTVEELGNASGWNGGAKGLDWPANLKGVGFGNTSATQAASDAIDKAIAADMASRGQCPAAPPQVLLTGHSQGGIVAANLAADSSFADRYQVRGIISAGSPQETIPIPKDVTVFNFQNARDIVPRTDLGGINVDFGPQYQRNIHNIVMEHSGSSSLGHTHNPETYIENIKALEAGEGKNASAIQDANGAFSDFYGGKTTGYQVQFGRETP